MVYLAHAHGGGASEVFDFCDKGGPDFGSANWLSAIFGSPHPGGDSLVGQTGSGAGDFNAKYGIDPGFSFYTHVSDQHGPYHVTVISAATHEAPYVLDGLLHHGTGLEIDTHYTDTGGATDPVFALCRMLGFRYCPRLRDFPDRRMACIEAPGQYLSLKPLLLRPLARQPPDAFPR